ncbi:MAG: o-succinylbenzoate--CoA ligase, partial [Actinomycetes bacterium]
LLPLPSDAAGQRLREAAYLKEPVDGDMALLLPTSGSTGDPKLVELPSSALRSSASATHARLHGQGAWLLALPLTHVAGWQVLVRSVVAGTTPAVLDTALPFTPQAFAAASATLGSDRPRYTALVPTQLRRLLDDPAGLAALATFDAVIVGGAATPPSLLARALEERVNVLTTYGMTETSGGCVYDGEPLDGVRMRIAGDARVLLGGSTLAMGYRGDDAQTEAFVRDAEGSRWFRTGDAGAISDDGTLRLLGRIDDVIVTGGEKVSPTAVERLLLELPGVHAALVFGVPDDEWGHAVVALVEADDRPRLAEVREVVAERLGRHAAPKRVLDVPHIPVTGLGKPDRGAAWRLVRDAGLDMIADT